MRYLWRNCKYLIISLIIIIILSYLIYRYTNIPTEIWCLIDIFIGYGVGRLENRRK